MEQNDNNNNEYSNIEWLRDELNRVNSELLKLQERVEYANNQAMDALKSTVKKRVSRRIKVRDVTQSIVAYRTQYSLGIRPRLLDVGLTPVERDDSIVWGDLTQHQTNLLIGQEHSKTVIGKTEVHQGRMLNLYYNKSNCLLTWDLEVKIQTISKENEPDDGGDEDSDESDIVMHAIGLHPMQSLI